MNNGVNDNSAWQPIEWGAPTDEIVVDMVADAFNPEWVWIVTTKGIIHTHLFKDINE